MSFTMIGELINTTRSEIQRAVAQRDEGFILKLTGRQEDAGAGIQNEKQDMQWLVRTVQSAARLPLCIDSPDPDVLASVWDILDRPPGGPGEQPYGKQPYCPGGSGNHKKANPRC